MIIDDARLVTPHGVVEGWLRIERGVVAEIGEGPAPSASQRPSLDGAWLGPGFIDQHIHGGFGIDLAEASVDQILQLSERLPQHGVTSYLATTATTARAATTATLATIESARAIPTHGARIEGVHMEGPFLSEDCRGAHPAEYLRDGALDELDEYLAAADVRMMTLAPERQGNDRVIAELRRRGIVVSVGHSAADVDGVERAVRAGARSVTHLFNGMRPLHHRDPGLVGAALLHPGLVCELIGDGVHVSGEALAIAARMKGIRDIVLVSDAGPSAGGSASANGARRLEDGTLASSALMLDAGFANFCRAAALEIPDAWPAVSANAARLLGLDSRGRVAVGAEADLTAIDDEHRVIMTIIRGRVVHRR